jgi:hypothetical protein
MLCIGVMSDKHETVTKNIKGLFKILPKSINLEVIVTRTVSEEQSRQRG